MNWQHQKNFSKRQKAASLLLLQPSTPHPSFTKGNGQWQMPTAVPFHPQCGWELYPSCIAIYPSLRVSVPIKVVLTTLNLLMCLFHACLIQKHSSTDPILVLKSTQNSLMCTDLGLSDPKLSSLGSSVKRGYSPDIHNNPQYIKQPHQQTNKHGLIQCSKDNPQLTM